MALPPSVQITEVGARDGLQNEKQPVPAAIKIELCKRLLGAHLCRESDIDGIKTSRNGARARRGSGSIPVGIDPGSQRRHRPVSTRPKGV